MQKTTYTKVTHVLRDYNGNYLKEGSTDPEAPIFVDNEKLARQFNGFVFAQAYAGRINEHYNANGIIDVWGQPKQVQVYRMTITTVVEPATVSDPR